MRRFLSFALVLWTGLGGGGVEAKERHLTVAFTGDNGGEVATCGCAHSPVGGLPRRKTLLEGLRRGEPTLVLDSGNALFATESTPDATATRRASLLLDVMGELETAAMPAGARDLSAGAAFLATEAARAHLPVLSVNLMRAGKRVFEASRMVTVGGLRVALIGVSPRGAVHGSPELEGADAVPRVAALAKTLRAEAKADVVLVLAAAPFNEALLLSQTLGVAVDFVLFSHDGRGTGIPLPAAGNTLLLSGDRGRAVAVLELSVSGPGRFVDLGEKARRLAAYRQLQATVKETGAREAALKVGPEREALGRTLVGFERRLTEQADALRALPEHPPRGFSVAYRMLGEDLPEDEALVLRVHPLDPLLPSRYTPHPNP